MNTEELALLLEAYVETTPEATLIKKSHQSFLVKYGIKTIYLVCIEEEAYSFYYKLINDDITYGLFKTDYDVVKILNWLTS